MQYSAHQKHSAAHQDSSSSDDSQAEAGDYDEDSESDEGKDVDQEVSEGTTVETPKEKPQETILETSMVAQSSEAGSKGKAEDKQPSLEKGVDSSEGQNKTVNESAPCEKSGIFVCIQVHASWFVLIYKQNYKYNSGTQIVHGHIQTCPNKTADKYIIKKQLR